MTVLIEPFDSAHLDAVRSLNTRLREGGHSTFFSETPSEFDHATATSEPQCSVFEERFVAAEQENARGAYCLKYQQFRVNGVESHLADYRLPISEGVINSRFGMIGLLLLRDAMKRESRMIAVGMGGLHEPLGKLLTAWKWRLVLCPFFFQVVKPFQFLRKCLHLRKRPWLKLAADAAAFSGTGWLAVKGAHFLKRSYGHRRGCAADLVPHFDPDWCDPVWHAAKDSYAMIAVRTANVLNELYPAGDTRFERLRVMKNGSVVGWAVALNTQMIDHNYFGNMRVGSVADCLAVPGFETDVISAVSIHLRHNAVDLIVSNQLSNSWCRAFSAKGYLSAPSNFALAVSPQLANDLHPFEEVSHRIHLNRGDGDGPINL